MIALESGVHSSDIRFARESGDWSKLPYNGYLCNIPIEEFGSELESLLPQSISGSDFIEVYGETTDRFSQIRPERFYEVASCTAHPIFDNARTHEFMHGITKFKDLAGPEERTDRLSSLGQLMYKSHNGYSACGLGSSRTDEIVAAAMEMESEGIFGARITGGGSGGTVCLLAHGEGGNDAVRELHRQFCQKYGEDLVLFE